ncbi:YncE family protein [Rugamonas rubra]|uniref:40-residue YVTN family beta-propeller repeat-containing protein n=1 Tax=Rugamonas rubra TaxID=758825 RepID=A0A1I4NWJ5_9BURK|nr:YncE family protein [Rugamonas rubra]SFM19901.1 40-residue YVTN family beta-propeller repeat-containing protein [Rugamonas rubra]
MNLKPRRTTLAVTIALAVAGLGIAGYVVGAAPAAPAAPAAAAAPAYSALPGMPPLADINNVYGSTGPANMSAAVKGHLARVYVPNLRSNDVYVIDQETLKVVDKFKVGLGPQHVVPGWDLRTLWAANNAERTDKGSLTPIDPLTGKPGKSVPVDDPYNMYFTPDGKSAIVVAEARHRLDFRHPQTMAMQYSIDTPGCAGINHADFSNDGRFAVFTCEFDGTIAKIDLVERKVTGYLKLKMPATRFAESVPVGGPPGEVCSSKKGMPQDIRISPDGKKFYIADMDADGVHVVDGVAFKEIGFIATGVGAHGIYPSRDGKKFYVANRGTHRIHGKRRGKGSVSVIDFATDKVVGSWVIPGGGSPDMGNVSADGKYLWLSGRFDDVVYRIDTTGGKVDQIRVGQEPHGLTVWPQPGRYSLGHTGNLR